MEGKKTDGVMEKKKNRNGERGIIFVVKMGEMMEEGEGIFLLLIIKITEP